MHGFRCVRASASSIALLFAIAAFSTDALAATPAPAPTASLTAVPTPTAKPWWWFEVTATPVSQTTKCPATITFTSVQHNGTGGLEYRYVRSDGARGPIYVSPVSAGVFPRNGATWTLGKTYSGWEAIEWRPMQLPHESGRWQINSNKAKFSLICT